MIKRYKVKVKRDKLVKRINKAYDLGYKFKGAYRIGYGEGMTKEETIELINGDGNYSHVWLYFYGEDNSITWSYYEVCLEREHVKVKFKEFCKLVKR